MLRIVPLAALLLTSASVLGQTVTRVSLDSNGNQVPLSSHTVSISPDGRFVAFDSFATFQDPADSNGKADIYVRDRQTGITVCASLGANGVTGVEDSWDPSISGDGRYVAFRSEAGLVPADADFFDDIYLRDMQQGVTILISADPTGGSADQDCEDPEISADGRFVVFETRASNLLPGGNGVRQIYAYEVQTGLLSRVSVSTSGVIGDSSSLDPAISADGRYVAFLSYATNFDPNDTNLEPDIFRHDRLTGETIRVNLSTLGVEGDRSSAWCSISADGNLVAFQSAATNLVPSDNNFRRDVFVRDIVAGTLERVSVSTSGVEPNADCRLPVISGNGRFVTFESLASNLVPADRNNEYDVFLHDRTTRELRRVSTTTSGVEGNEASQKPTLSFDGRFVAFESLASNLITSDTNGVKDVFFHDLIHHELVGFPSSPNLVHFEVSRASGETGHRAQVLLSCAGKNGFPLPGGGTVPLTFDACTSLGLSLSFLLSGTIDANGRAVTPTVAFPAVPPGTRVYSAAVTIDLAAGAFVSVTGPEDFVTL